MWSSPPGSAFAPRGGPAAAICSWSGGKDAALAHYLAREAGFDVVELVTMMTEDATRSRSHGLSRSILEAQAACVGIPIRFVSTSWPRYTRRFRTALHDRSVDASHVIFGDIAGDRARRWIKSTAEAAGITPVVPLWRRTSRDAVEGMLAAGYRAVIIAVRDGVVRPDVLGRTLDPGLVGELARTGIDVAGERGEYHTLVTDGPTFRRPLTIEFGDVVLRDGVWFLDVTPANSRASDAP
jgi:diphthine-ammonia ligase